MKMIVENLHLGSYCPSENDLKATVYHKLKCVIHVLFINLDCLDFCLLSNIMELNGVPINYKCGAHSAPKNTFEKLNNVSLQKS